MIKESDLLEAIAECQGDKNPNANTCIKLAAYYTILDHLQETEPKYSFSKGHYDSGSEFSGAVRGLEMDEILPVMDELMDVVRVLIPKLYNATIDKLKDL